MDATTTAKDRRAQGLVRADDLVGLAEIAKLDGRSKQRIAQLADEPDFPPPLQVLAMGPVWDRSVVMPWLRRRRARQARREARRAAA